MAHISSHELRSLDQAQSPTPAHNSSSNESRSASPVSDDGFQWVPDGIRSARSNSPELPRYEFQFAQSNRTMQPDEFSEQSSYREMDLGSSSIVPSTAPAKRLIRPPLVMRWQFLLHTILERVLEYPALSKIIVGSQHLAVGTHSVAKSTQDAVQSTKHFVANALSNGATRVGIYTSRPPRPHG
jgi:hypothetical protein